MPVATTPLDHSGGATFLSSLTTGPHFLEADPHLHTMQDGINLLHTLLAHVHPARPGARAHEAESRSACVNSDKQQEKHNICGQADPDPEKEEYTSKKDPCHERVPKRRSRQLQGASASLRETQALRRRTCKA